LFLFYLFISQSSYKVQSPANPPLPSLWITSVFFLCPGVANWAINCRYRLEVSQQRWIFQTERFRAENALDFCKYIRALEWPTFSILHYEASQIYKQK